MSEIILIGDNHNDDKDNESKMFYFKDNNSKNFIKKLIFSRFTDIYSNIVTKCGFFQKTIILFYDVNDKKKLFLLVTTMRKGTLN